MALSEGLIWLTEQERFASSYDARASGEETAAQRPFVTVIDVHDPTAPRVLGAAAAPADDSMACCSAGRIAAHGRHLHVTQGEEFDYIAGIMTLRAPEGDGPPEYVDTLEFPLRSGGFVGRPFSSAFTGDQLWLASVRSETVVEVESATLLVVDTSDPEALAVIEERLVPAAIRSRRTEWFDVRSFSPSAVQMQATGDLILGSMYEGGLFGVRP